MEKKTKKQKTLENAGGLTRCHGELPFALQDDLAIVIHGRKHSLLEEDDVLLV